MWAIKHEVHIYVLYLDASKFQPFMSRKVEADSHMRSISLDKLFEFFWGPMSWSLATADRSVLWDWIAMGLVNTCKSPLINYAWLGRKVKNHMNVASNYRWKCPIPHINWSSCDLWKTSNDFVANDTTVSYMQITFVTNTNIANSIKEMYRQNCIMLTFGLVRIQTS
jgi:hypothetical protein